MRVFYVLPAEGYLVPWFESENDSAEIEAASRPDWAGVWKPVVGRAAKREGDAADQLPDLTRLANSMLCNDASRDALCSDKRLTYLSFLPILVDGAQWWCVRIPTRLVVDPEKSEFVTVLGDRRVLLKGWVRGSESNPLFRVRDLPSPVYCTDAFVEFVDTHGLRGLVFRELPEVS